MKKNNQDLRQKEGQAQPKLFNADSIASMSWKKRLMYFLLLLIVMNLVSGWLGRIFPVAGRIFQFVYYAAILIGLPVTILYKESSVGKLISSKGKAPRNLLREILLATYSLGLAVSFLMAFGSVFVFDGQGLAWARIGTFISAVFLPLSIILAMIQSRKSLLWFLVPLLPFVTLKLFANALDKYISNSNIEFCEGALRRNDRKILDNPTLGCNKILQ